MGVLLIMAEAAARPAVRLGIAPSTRFPDRNVLRQQHTPTHQRRPPREEGIPMAKFSGTTRNPLRANVMAPIRTRTRRMLTHERGVGYARDAESDLFLLAATNMVGEDTFYEAAATRDARFAELVHEVTTKNPAFLAGADVEAGKVGLVQYLRETMLMRSATVVMAAEYVAAGGAGGRSVVARALQRADEPPALLGHWRARPGRTVPMPIKPGLPPAARPLPPPRA